MPGSSRRVESWIYAIINPLLEQLEGEIEVLQAGDLTFDHRLKKLQLIRRLRDHLASSYRPIYDDMLEGAVASGSVNVAQLARTRDETRDGLEASARRLHETLLASESLRARLRDAVARYRKPGRPEPWGAWPEEELPELVASLLTNNRIAFRPESLTHDFWRDHGESLRRLLDEDASLHERRERVRAHRERLLAADRELQSGLVKLRADLCEKHDLTAAPFRR